MGSHAGRLIFETIFASEIWGAHFREGLLLLLFFYYFFLGGGRGLLSEFYGMLFNFVLLSFTAHMLDSTAVHVLTIVRTFIIVSMCHLLFGACLKTTDLVIKQRHHKLKSIYGQFPLAVNLHHV